MWTRKYTQSDNSVGMIMQHLDEQHLDDNTLVIFASDNGIQEEGSTKASFFHSSGPLRGVKCDMYEGGIRVPFIALACDRAGKVDVPSADCFL